MPFKPYSKTLEFSDNALAILLFGPHHANLRYLEDILKVDISDRGNTVRIAGRKKAVEMTENCLQDLWEQLKENKKAIETSDIDSQLRFFEERKKHPKNKSAQERAMTTEKQTIILKKKELSARSPNQARYIEALKQNDMIFGLGPAGTGKTYLAVAMAVSLYEQKAVDRMIFCRPAVEAGEKLGYLPGDMKDKIDPYLSPIYDALYDFLGAKNTETLMQRGDIEIAPLAFMRGRTLSSACVVLDEAQNTTSSQMKMFLSRMGEDSKMIITGDPDQVDLLANQVSGLYEASKILEGIDEVAFIRFNHDDVMRHKLVGKILKAYEKARG